MAIEPARAKYARLLAPTIAVLLSYTLVFAIPLRSQIHSLDAESQRYAKGFETLQRRAQTQPQELQSVRMASAQLDLETNRFEDAITEGVTDGSRFHEADQTAVQTFAKVIHVLQQHNVKCVAVETETCEKKQPRFATTAYVVDMTGDFHDVLGALKAIEADLQQASVVLLSMHRLDPTEPCRWKSEFRLRENAQ